MRHNVIIAVTMVDLVFKQIDYSRRKTTRQRHKGRLPYNIKRGSFGDRLRKKIFARGSRKATFFNTSCRVFQATFSLEEKSLHSFERGLDDDYFKENLKPDELSMAQKSLLSMEGGNNVRELNDLRSRRESLDFTAPDQSINTIELLVRSLDTIFRHQTSWPLTKLSINNLLQKLDLSTQETNKYTFWDVEKPYTRNLIHTDGKHYSLLLLCWNPGKESSIHNHPCDGCFVKCIRGCIRETSYTIHEETNEVRQGSVRFCNEGQITSMSDDIGLHKIGNPNKDTGSVSLHLYTPPFKSCSIWATAGVGKSKCFEEGKMGFFSVCGHRTPQLEGRPGRQAKLMEEILAHFNSSQCSDKAAACDKKVKERVNDQENTLCSA